MVFLLVFHNDPERPPHAFLLQRVSDRVLVTNLQLFHRSPPPSYSAGRERRLLSRRLTCSCPASACTPACGPPDQSFYGLRLPHRTLSPVVEAKCLVGKVADPDCGHSDQSFRRRFMCVCQTRTAQILDPPQPLCPQDQALCRCLALCFRPTAPASAYPFDRVR